MQGKKSDFTFYDTLKTMTNVWLSRSACKRMTPYLENATIKSMGVWAKKTTSLFAMQSSADQSNHDSSSSNSSTGSSPQGQLAELDPKLGQPKMYRVLLLNDDYTPMDFVVLVLKRFFAKNEEEANKIMLDVHKKGAGTAGVYTLEVAEMKVMQANQLARSNQYPLKCTLEPA